MRNGYLFWETLYLFSIKYSLVPTHHGHVGHAAGKLPVDDKIYPARLELVLAKTNDTSPWFTPLGICHAFKRFVFVMLLYCTLSLSLSHRMRHVTSRASGQKHSLRAESKERFLNENRGDVLLILSTTYCRI